MNITLLLTTLGATLLLLFLWLVVQQAWQRSFPERSGVDPLQGQFSCGNCGCGTSCQRERAATPGAKTKEIEK